MKHNPLAKFFVRDKAERFSREEQERQRVYEETFVPRREREQRQADFEETLDVISRAVGAPEAKTLAEQIILAGKKARGEIALPSLAPPEDSLAAKILAAGEKRRKWSGR